MRHQPQQLQDVEVETIALEGQSRSLDKAATQIEEDPRSSEQRNVHLTVPRSVDDGVAITVEPRQVAVAPVHDL